MDPLVSGLPSQKFILRPLHKLRLEEGVEAFMNYKLMPSLVYLKLKTSSFLTSSPSRLSMRPGWRVVLGIYLISEAAPSDRYLRLNFVAINLLLSSERSCYI